MIKLQKFFGQKLHQIFANPQLKVTLTVASFFFLGLLLAQLTVG